MNVLHKKLNYLDYSFYNKDQLQFCDNGCSETRVTDKGYNNDKFIVQQFTGILDKVGKEIYEGDIVRIIEPGWEEYEIVVGIIEFDFGCFWINNIPIYELMVNGVFDGKVEGNIFENPELIKNETKEIKN